MNKQTAWVLGMLLSGSNIVKTIYRRKSNETHLSFIYEYPDTEVLFKIKKY